MIESYKNLMQSFLSNNISAIEYERGFLNLWHYQNENKLVLPYLLAEEIINNHFYDIDSFCSDISLIDEDDIDEDELRKRVQQYYKSLCNLDSLKPDNKKSLKESKLVFAAINKVDNFLDNNCDVDYLKWVLKDYIEVYNIENIEIRSIIMEIYNLLNSNQNLENIKHDMKILANKLKELSSKYYNQ